MPERLSGGCQCGALRYQLGNPAKRTCICHCRMCQKASGQPFMAFATFDENDLRWTRGAPATFKSSNLAERGYCRDCGTPLFFKFEGHEISVTIGSLDDPSEAPPTVQKLTRFAQAEFFSSSAGVGLLRAGLTCASSDPASRPARSCSPTFPAARYALRPPLPSDSIRRCAQT
jgi:hypothetical protein